jgi:hypothetical protein
MLRFLRSQALILKFDGTGDDGGDGDGGDGSDGSKSGDTNEKMFTQDQVNTFVAEEKRKAQEKNKQLATQLTELRKNSALSKEERDSLQSQIENLQSQYMTAEEKAKIQEEKLRKSYDTELINTQAERDTWQRKHSELMIETEITRAASTNSAISVEQIAAILVPKTKLVEKLDDEGKPTGAFEPRVKFDDIDKNDKPITLDITVPEAVKRMRELDRYVNLFVETKKSGIGSTGSYGKGKTPDLAKIAQTDPKEYRRLRKEKPELFATM